MGMLLCHLVCCVYMSVYACVSMYMHVVCMCERVSGNCQCRTAHLTVTMSAHLLHGERVALQ